MYCCSTLHTSTHAMNCCYVDFKTMYTTFSIKEELDLVAIVDCTHVGSAKTSFKDLVTLHRRTLPT